MDMAKCNGYTGIEHMPVCPEWMRDNCLRYLAPASEPQDYAAPDFRFTADYLPDCRSRIPRDHDVVIAQPDE